MGCFVRVGKSLRDVLSRVSENGMGCFVLHSHVMVRYVFQELWSDKFLWSYGRISFSGVMAPTNLELKYRLFLTSLQILRFFSKTHGFCLVLVQSRNSPSRDESG